MTPHIVTIYNKYDNGQKYKRTLIENCKFVPHDSVTLGNVKVQGSSSGKLFVYEKDLVMDDYHEPRNFNGDGFTFDTETIVAIGNSPEIISVKDLKDFEHYTVVTVIHQNYSFILPHHFSLEVK